MLGGSEGGLRYGQQWAKLLTKKGYDVMALPYFGAEGQAPQLEEIPFEYFQAALDTLKSLPGVKPINWLSSASQKELKQPCCWLPKISPFAW